MNEKTAFALGFRAVDEKAHRRLFLAALATDIDNMAGGPEIGDTIIPSVAVRSSDTEWEERWSNAPIDSRGYVDLRDPKVIDEARDRADARDLAEKALAERLEAAPKIWAVVAQNYTSLVHNRVLAIFGSEEAANAALPMFAHAADDTHVAELPYFPA